MKVQAACNGCGRWLPIPLTELCVDCGSNLCHECAVATQHRTVHEDAAPGEDMPEGWEYLRCGDTPYSIHEQEA